MIPRSIFLQFSDQFRKACEQTYLHLGRVPNWSFPVSLLSEKRNHVEKDQTEIAARKNALAL